MGESSVAAIVQSRSRLMALNSYDILDTPPEAAFDELVGLAARLCGTPVAAVSLLDSERQWFKASVGLSVRQTDVSASFCQHALALRDLFEVQDAQAHPTLRHSPLVVGDPKLRFYAGYPLVTGDGNALGTLMVADYVPRQLSADQRDILRILARQVMVALDLHRQRAQLRLRLREQAHYHALLYELAERDGAAAYWGRQRPQQGLFLSPEAWTLLGMKPQELCSDDDLRQAMGAADRERWQQALVRCESDGVPMDVECAWQVAGGALTTRWLALRALAQAGHPDKLLGMVVDVTTRRQADQMVQRINERFRLAAELISDALWDWELANGTMWWSTGMFRLFGYPDGNAFPAENSLALVHAEDRAGLEASIQAALDDGQSDWSHIYRFMRADGSFAWVENRARIVRDADGKALRMVGSLSDITERRRAQAEREADMARLRQQALLLDQARDAITVKDLHHRIQFWNAGAERLYGWRKDEVLGRHAPTLLHEDPQLQRQIEERLHAHGEFQHHIAHRHKDGRRLDIRAHWTLIRDESGQPTAIFATCTDITQSLRDRERIQSLAFYDQLTQLPNRTLLTDRLMHALAAGRRSQYFSALMFLDLDNFKSLNDTLGHAKGDELLQQAAHRLQSCVRGADTVARLGGDEFVVLLEELGDDPDQAAWQAEAIADKVLVQLRQPFVLGEHTHLCTASVGVTVFNGEAHSTDALLKEADIAMYEAKQSGRNAVRFFDPAMQQRVFERAAVENDLRRASVEKEFVLHYQPQWGRDGRLCGMEALLRWQHPTRGLLKPPDFLPVAEDSGLILPLGRWVLQQASRQLADWHRAGKSLRMSVNVSVSQLRSERFVSDVRAALLESGAPPGQLSLELTESMLARDRDAAVDTMSRIKEMGVRIALDDFGTGYSSLSVLERLPIDDLKIDRSFVHRLGRGERDDQIVKSIVALGKALDLNIVAEGIETEDQQALLQAFGCDEFQGFLRGRSMPAEVATAML